MRKILPIWAVLIALFWSAPLAALEIGGRDVIIEDLRKDRSVPGPLIVALHGQFEGPKRFRGTSRLDTLAEALGAVIAYPQAVGEAWQAGQTPRDASDVAYLSRVIRTLQANPQVAPRPVLVIGHGQGGAMALRMACDAPDLVLGVGVVSGKLLRSYPCRSGRPLPTVLMHGTADPILPHDGGAATLSASETVAIWAARNRCSNNVRVRRVDQTRGDNTSVVIRQYETCRAVLSHVQILGGGYGWPGGRATSSRTFGPQTRDIRAVDELLRVLGPVARIP